MNIKYEVPKEYINKGVIDLKKNFKIKLSNSDINIGKCALAILIKKVINILLNLLFMMILVISCIRKN